MKHWNIIAAAALLVGCSAPIAAAQQAQAGPWDWHRIAVYTPAGGDGSDGVSLVDYDGDGDLDALGAWESGHGITLSMHPTAGEDEEQPWNLSELLGVDQPMEDAEAADFDGDGEFDVIGVSVLDGAHGGGFWLRFGDSPAIDLDQHRNNNRWLIGVTVDLDADGDLDILGGGQTSRLNLWTNPGGALARDPSQWAETTIATAKHVMAILPEDVDGDGDLDLIVSQRLNVSGSPPGLYWLEQGAAWARHDIGAQGLAGTITCRGDLDGDGDADLVQPYWQYGDHLHLHGRVPGGYLAAVSISGPRTTDRAKGCAIGDIDGDGDADIVLALHGGQPIWLGTQDAGSWSWTMLSPLLWGNKTDEPVLSDVDGDGDLDVWVSVEYGQQAGLGWLENPQ